MSYKQSALHQLQQQNSVLVVRASSTTSTRYDQVNERLQEFIRYFVKESEAKFYSYHLVLEGELKKSGNFTEAFSNAVGCGIGGAVGIAGVYLGLSSGGAKALSKAGKTIGKKVGEKLGNERYAKEVRKLSDLVNLSQKFKAAFREVLVETAFDIFQSFEMQFMNVHSKESSSNAMHVLAKDAINRAVNYMKKNKESSMSEGILLGESKRSLESLRSGFSITYTYLSCVKTWNTADLYSRVGVFRVNDGTSQYFRKKESDTGKYGYRRLFVHEKWDALSKIYIYDQIAESNSGQFTDYEYVLDLQDMKVKCGDILKKINSDDKHLAEDRIKELLKEAKTDILEEINILKMQGCGHSEDLQRLESIQMSLENFCLEDRFNEMKLFLREINEEIAKLIEEHSQAIVQQIEKLSSDSKEQHGNTQAVLEKLNEGVGMVQKEQIRNKRCLQQIDGGVSKINKNVREILRQQTRTKKDPIWFDMRESTGSFTGRQRYLDKIVEFVQKGVVVITGLSGVGKSELAIKYARTCYSSDDYVIWINSKNRQGIKRSFYRLYERLEFKIDEESVIEKDIKDIAQDVYSHICSKKSLVIFDDAVKYATIKDVLPRGLPPDVNKPHVLITSLSLEVEGGIRLPLGDFEIEESVEFIKKKISVKCDSQNSEIQDLAKKLHNFPLALQQAVANISEEDRRQKNFDSEKEFTISNYLKEFDEDAEGLLKNEEFKKLGSDYEKTTFRAIQITLSKIGSQPYAQTALEILNTMAYFSTDSIPAELFLQTANGNGSKLGGAIQLLKDYCIVSGKGLLNIHGLVQNVVTLELAKKKKEEIVLHNALQLIKKHKGKHVTIQNYITHIISVWSYASKYDTLVDTFIVNYTDDCEIYRTYFHLIMESSSFEVVTKVLQKIEVNHPKELNRIINQKCNDGTTPLYCAAMSGDERKVKLLVSKGANVDVETKHKSNLLHVAARNGYEETVLHLLQKGISVNSQTEYKFTPLHLAVKGNHLEIVHHLLSKGADTTMQTARKFTPLHFAVKAGSVDIVETLLKNSPVTDKKVGKVDIVETSLKNNPVADKKVGRVGIVKTSVKNSPVTDKTRHEYTPLHLAAKEGQLEVLKVLLKWGADVYAKTRLKFTPLHFSAKEGHLGVVQALLNENATVNAKDANKFTPLHLAAFYGHTDVVLTLLDHKADFSAETTKGNTPLHLASERGHLKVVEILISNGASHDVMNKEGKTPLDLAIKGNFEKMRDYIIQQTSE